MAGYVRPRAAIAPHVLQNLREWYHFVQMKSWERLRVLSIFQNGRQLKMKISVGLLDFGLYTHILRVKRFN